MPTNVRLCLQDILSSAEEIAQFVQGMDLPQYQADARTRRAVERLLQILTEAAYRLGSEGAALCPEIEWSAVRGLGNFLRHEYDKVDDTSIWTTLKERLPQLEQAVRRALAELDAASTKMGVLLSGRGSNFLALATAIQTGKLSGASIAVVLSDKADAPGLDAARELGLPAFAVPQVGRGAEARATQEAEVLRLLAEHGVQLVCLAGYMRIISPRFVATYPGRILNMHPSLLPSFPGLHAQRQALEFGAKVAGCTVHFVDEEVDHGVVVLQRAVPVEDADTEETLSARILREEHLLYPEAIARVLSGEYAVRGRRFVRRQELAQEQATATADSLRE